MRGPYVRSALAAAAGLLLVLPAAARFGPEGAAVTKAWGAGALWLLPPLLLSLRGGREAAAGPDEDWQASLPEIILLLLAAASLFTAATAGPWHFFIDWPPAARFNPLRSGPASLFFLWALFWTASLLSRGKMGGRFPLLLFCGVLGLCFLALMSETGGAPLYRDDHPSFMFRLWAFGKIFPRLTSYTPFWNGGVAEGVISKTGVLGPGLLLWPLWKFGSVERVYTPAVGFLYIFFIPLLTALSVRLAGLPARAAWVGGLLSVAVSQTWFLWFLHFGTIGANLSAAFALPFAACLYRVVVLDDRRAVTVILLSLSALFLLFWPPGGIMVLFVLAAAALHVRRLSAGKVKALLVAGGLTAALYLRPAAVILKGTDLLAFVLQRGGGDGGSTAPGADVFAAGLETLVQEAHRANPLLLLLGLGGLFVMREKKLQRWLALPALLFALTAAWGEKLLPNLQLGRMVLPLLVLSVLPAAAAADRLLSLPRRRWGALQSLLLALLLLSGVNGARLFGNGGPAPYTVLSPEVRKVVETVRREVPPGGRALFAGTTVHAYGRGHVAFLPAMAEREMMAADYYAFPPRTVEQNYPPRRYRLTREDTFRFMDLYNVSLVFTYHRDWREYFLDQPERYEALSISTARHAYSTFRVLRNPSPLLEGEGVVEADFNVIRVRPAPGQKRLVLRYNWNDSLQAAGKAAIAPQPVWKDLTFIAVEPNGEEEVVIRHRSRL